MLTLHHSDHNRMIIVPLMYPPLLGLQAEILVRDGPAIMNSSLHRPPGEVTTYKYTIILNLEYQRRKSVLIIDNKFGLLMASKHLSTRWLCHLCYPML